MEITLLGNVRRIEKQPIFCQTTLQTRFCALRRNYQSECCMNLAKEPFCQKLIINLSSAAARDDFFGTAARTHFAKADKQLTAK